MRLTDRTNWQKYETLQDVQPPSALCPFEWTIRLITDTEIVPIAFKMAVVFLMFYLFYVIWALAFQRFVGLWFYGISFHNLLHLRFVSYRSLTKRTQTCSNALFRSTSLVYFAIVENLNESINLKFNGKNIIRNKIMYTSVISIFFLSLTVPQNKY